MFTLICYDKWGSKVLQKNCSQYGEAVRTALNTTHSMVAESYCIYDENYKAVRRG